MASSIDNFSLSVKHKSDTYQISIEPSASLFQLLERICKKASLDVNLYTLSSIASVYPDLSASLGQSKISKGTRVLLTELKVKRKAAASVMIALQLEDGSRLKEKFSPASTLWEMLTFFEDKPEVEISLTKRIESIEGKDVYFQPTLNFSGKTFQTSQQLIFSSLQSIGLNSGSALVRLNMVSTLKDGKDCVDYLKEITKQLNTFNDCTDIEFKEAVVANGSKTETNLVPTADQLAEKKIQELLKKQQSIPSPSHSSDQIPKQRNRSIFDAKEESRPQQPATLQELFGISLEPTKDDDEEEEQFPFKNFKFPTKSKEDWVVVPKEAVVNDYKKLENRDICIFKLEDLASMNNPDISEGFFDITMNDMKTHQNILKNERVGLTEAPMMTKKMREDKKHKNYKQTCLRITFPERYVLQGLFYIDEPLAHLFEFVEEHIESIKSASDSFQLLVSPPPRVLDNTFKKTLKDFDLFPKANIHIKTENMQLKESSKQSYLENFESVTKRAKVVQIESDPSSTASTTATKSSRASSSNHTSQPKWMRLSKK